MLSKRPDGRPEHGGAVRDALAVVQRSSMRPPPPRAVSIAERRVMSLVMTAGAMATDATLLPSERAEVEARARAAVLERSGELQVLANGATVATTGALGAPTDQAACAARCAL